MSLRVSPGDRSIVHKANTAVSPGLLEVWNISCDSTTQAFVTFETPFNPSITSQSLPRFKQRVLSTRSTLLVKLLPVRCCFGFGAPHPEELQQLRCQSPSPSLRSFILVGTRLFATFIPCYIQETFAVDSLR